MLIKHYKINQNNLQATHDLISGNNAGLIVSENNRRLYYQDADGSKKPLVIGTADFYDFISDDGSDIRTLQVGRKYIRTGSHVQFTLPTAELCQASGDIIEFYNRSAYNLLIKQSSTTLVNITDGTSGQYYKFYWNGSNWQYIKGGGDEVFSDIDSLIENINQYWDYDNSTPIYVSALPSATLTSNVDLPATGAMGIVNVVSAEFDTTLNRVPSANISGNAPIDGTTLAKHVAGEINHALSTNIISANSYGNYGLVYTDVLPSATTTGDYGIVTIESNYTSATISGNANPMAASAVYNFVSGIDINSKISGRLTGVEINGTTYAEVDGDAVAHLGEGYAQVVSPQVGEYVKRTVDGYTTDPGIATVSSLYNSSNVSNNILTVDGTAIPIIIQTDKGNLYPIEKGSLSAGTGANAGKFLIDITPYLSYDNSNVWNSGNWIVYYGAGINDLYTTANTVTSATISNASAPYPVNFEVADVHVLTINTADTVTLLVTNLAKGHGMIIKVINTAGATVMFAGHAICATTGTYSFSVFSFDGTHAEQVGEVTQVYASQVL